MLLYSAPNELNESKRAGELLLAHIRFNGDLKQ